jgi:hypothetical protein
MAQPSDSIWQIVAYFQRDTLEPGPCMAQCVHAIESALESDSTLDVSVSHDPHIVGFVCAGQRSFSLNEKRSGESLSKAVTALSGVASSDTAGAGAVPPWVKSFKEIDLRKYIWEMFSGENPEVDGETGISLSGLPWRVMTVTIRTDWLIEADENVIDDYDRRVRVQRSHGRANPLPFDLTVKLMRIVAQHGAFYAFATADEYADTRGGMYYSGGPAFGATTLQQAAEHEAWVSLRDRAKEYARNVYWGNLFGPELMKKIGPVEAFLKALETIVGPCKPQYQAFTERMGEGGGSLFFAVDRWPLLLLPKSRQLRPDSHLEAMRAAFLRDWLKRHDALL